MTETMIARDLTIGLIAALIGGIVATRLRLPAVIGFLIAGIMVGPYTPGVTGDTARIQLLAEIGVVLLMFGVGVDFSLEQLRSVRRIALTSGVSQVVLTIVLGVAIGAAFGWPWSWQIFFGCIVALSSTTVLMKLLMDRGELGSQHGQIAIGISLVQDIGTVVIMTLLPALTTSGDSLIGTAAAIGWSLLRAGVFLALMLLLGARLYPWLLELIARTGSRELFLLATIAMSVGTALLATVVFGLSLALGAFVAGLVVSESELHYRILGEVLPIRDLFSAIFFVSVGMLIDPSFMRENLAVVLLVALVIVVGKFAITALVAWPFPYARRTILLVAAGLAQIGEFSFILAQQGLALGAFDSYLYNLTLNGALLSIIATPLLMRAVDPLHAVMNSLRAPRASRPAVATPEVPGGLRDHVIICGYGRVGAHLAEALRTLGHPCLVIDQDWARARQAREAGNLVIYGDATASAVLQGAQLHTARALVVTIPDPAVQRLVVQQARQQCPELAIIARAYRMEDLPLLYSDGADEVVMPAFEGGLEMLRQTLLRLGVSIEQVQNYADAVHDARYAPWQQQEAGTEVLQRLRSASNRLLIRWFAVPEGSPHARKPIGELNVRARTGASIAAIVRGGEVIVNPGASMTLQPGDRLAVMGTTGECQRFAEWLSAGAQTPIDVEAIPGCATPAEPLTRRSEA